MKNFISLNKNVYSFYYKIIINVKKYANNKSVYLNIYQY